MSDSPTNVQDDGADTSRVWTFLKGGDELTVHQWLEAAR